MTLFTEVSSWIAFPIIFALIAGKHLDKYFDTKPVIFLSLIIFSFFVSCFGICKILKKYMKNMAIDEDLKNKESNISK